MSKRTKTKTLLILIEPLKLHLMWRCFHGLHENNALKKIANSKNKKKKEEREREKIFTPKTYSPQKKREKKNLKTYFFHNKLNTLFTWILFRNHSIL